MTRDELLALCMARGLGVNQQAGWTQVGPWGAVGARVTDSRIFYVSNNGRFVDLRQDAGPAHLIGRARAEHSLVGNGQIVARIPIAFFSNGEWEVLVEHLAAQARRPGTGGTPLSSPSSSGASSDPAFRVGPAPIPAPHRPSAPSASVAAADAVEAARAKVASRLPKDRQYGEDLLATLRELAACARSQCPIAVLALCGKVLEVALKERLMRAGEKGFDDQSLGTLLRRCSEANLGYLDPALTNQANLIKAARNGAVHAKGESIPVPSDNQAHSAIFATLDVLERTYPPS